jgi:hypothetical protein
MYKDILNIQKGLPNAFAIKLNENALLQRFEKNGVLI